METLDKEKVKEMNNLKEIKEGNDRYYEDKGNEKDNL